MDQILIRKPTSADLQFLFPLWKEQINFHYGLDAEYYSSANADEDKHFEEYFSKALETNDPYFLVAEIDRKLAGFISYKKSHAQYQDSIIEEYGWVLELFVDEDYRKHGIGARLMDEAAKFFISEGLEYVKVEASIKNANAIQFYKDNGFKSRVEVMYKKIT